MVCHSKSTPTPPKKHDVSCQSMFSVPLTKIMWSPNHTKYSIYSAAATAAHTPRDVRASLFELSSAQSFEPRATATHAVTDRRALIDK